MQPRSRKHFRRLTVYLCATCFLLGAFFLRVWYGFDKPDLTTGQGDRIVTISIWYAPGADVETWYVCSRGIVCSTSDRLDLPEHVVYLDDAQMVELKSEVAKIPEHIRGTNTENQSVCDGSYLNVAFTPDGLYRHDEISAHHVCVKELDALFAKINALVPADRQIKYNEEMVKFWKEIHGGFARVIRMPQSDWNRYCGRVFHPPPPVNAVQLTQEDILPPSKSETTTVPASLL